MFAYTCLIAGKHDQADRILRDVLRQERERTFSLHQQSGLANTLGWLALNLLLQERYLEAEPLAREAVAINQNEQYRLCYWKSVLGAILLGQQKFTEAEPLLLQGYEGVKQNVGIHPRMKRRLNEATVWLVRFYEAVGQQEKARFWRETLRAGPSLPPEEKAQQPPGRNGLSADGR